MLRASIGLSAVAASCAWHKEAEAFSLFRKKPPRRRPAAEILPPVADGPSLRLTITIGFSSGGDGPLPVVVREKQPQPAMKLIEHKATALMASGHRGELTLVVDRQFRALEGSCRMWCAGSGERRHLAVNR